MTPAARVQAAIEVLDQVFAGVAAEKALTSWARRSRYAGSGDRAAVRDHVFDALRRRRSCAAAGGSKTGRGVMLGALRLDGENPDLLFCDTRHAPDPLSQEERDAGALPQNRAEALDIPDWLWPEFSKSLGAMAEETAVALKSRAPVHLRVNLIKTDVKYAKSLLERDGVLTEPHPASATALEVREGARRVRNSKAYLTGLVELQDAASQAVVDSMPLKDKMRVLDYCAGGGGKALALAARADIDLFVHDVDPHRMRDLPERAKRAGVTLAEIQTSDLAQSGVFDLILCDAPCSGSGAWRRAPQGKWLLSRDALGTLGETQARILDAAAQLVSEGGSLGYATCSLLRCENDRQTAGFLDRHADWTLDFQNSWHVTDGTDGFFAAHLTRAISEG